MTTFAVLYCCNSSVSLTNRFQNHFSSVWYTSHRGNFLSFPWHSKILYRFGYRCLCLMRLGNLGPERYGACADCLHAGPPTTAWHNVAFHWTHCQIRMVGLFSTIRLLRWKFQLLGYNIRARRQWNFQEWDVTTEQALVTIANQWHHMFVGWGECFHEGYVSRKYRAQRLSSLQSLWRMQEN